jgi:adenosylmethionine-8-amino-7-oxononanoate aminotransferase
MQGLKPVIIERGEGAVVYDAHGKAYVDAFASLWTVNVGHGRQEIVDAIAAQKGARLLPHVRHRQPALDQAGGQDRQASAGDLNHVFLTLGGGGR